MHSIKALARAVVCRTPLSSVFAPLTRGYVPVFMLHRFADPELGRAVGHDPRRLRSNLEYLSRQGYRFLSLGDALRVLTERPENAWRTMVFTVDDGYDDFRRVGWPIFEAYGCPVTVFGLSGFLDRICWCWWDRVEYAIDHARHREITLDVGRLSSTYVWSGASEKGVVIAALVRRLKDVSDSERLAALDQISAQSGVAWPDAAPPQYAPLSWDDVRLLGKRGVTFGPHSVTHPILSRAEDAQAEDEIRVSWERLRAETDAVVPVFCYPNGRREDFGKREIDVLRKLGLVGAVGAESGFVSKESLQSAPYALPRFEYPEDRDLLIQVVCGMERVIASLRRR